MCSRVARVRICSGSSRTALEDAGIRLRAGRGLPARDLPVHSTTAPEMRPHARGTQLVCQVVVQLFTDAPKSVRHGLDLLQPATGVSVSLYRLSDVSITYQLRYICESFRMPAAMCAPKGPGWECSVRAT